MIIIRKLTAIITVMILALFLGCSSDEGHGSASGTTKVTINIGGSPSEKLGAQAIPSAVSGIRITVSGSGMPTMRTSMALAGQTSMTADLNVTNGRGRKFLVEALDSAGAVLYNGSRTADLNGDPVTLEIALAFAVPTGLSARAFSSTRMDLSWSSFADATEVAGYNVYESGVKIASAAAPKYSHAGLSANTQYCYTVSALDAMGSESAKSGVSCATTTAATFSKTFGGLDGSHENSSVQQTSDGGYILAGRTVSGYDVWVLKLDPDGTVAWQKTYGGTDSEMAHAIEQTSDGGYVVAGSLYYVGADNWDAWVLKLDPDGNIEWQKTYGGAGTEEARSIEQTSDGGYIAAGFSNSFGAGNAWVFKLGPDGSVAWEKVYGGTDTANAYSVRQISDGGYIVAGSKYFVGAGNGDAWVLKLDPDGNIAWQKTYGETGWENAWSIEQTSDGGYVIAADSTSFSEGDYDYWVLKLNTDGNIEWQKTYGGIGSEYMYSIEQTSDGGYILSGETDSFGAASRDALLLKLNPDGTIAWQKTYGPSWDDWIFDVRQIQDGLITVGGTCPLGGACDLWVMKMKSDGAMGCGISADQGIVPFDTFSSPVDIFSAPIDSSAIVSDTSVIPQDSTSTLDTQCSDETGMSRVQINSITFADANLETCISTYAAAQGYAYTDQMTTLSCNARGITDITGLEWFTSLTDLRMYNNSIIDISALSGLTNLTILYLFGNGINDVSPLAGLTNLSELYIDTNSISDISALSGLTSLTILWLDYNSISDVSPLAGLMNLTQLSLYSNSITLGVATLTGLTSATTIDLSLNSSIPCADIAVLEAVLGAGIVSYTVTCP